jgi:adenosylhomocysteine nucleosidase
MIALLGAIREETSCLQKRMTIRESVSEDTCTIFRGTWLGRGPEMLLVQTGMGKHRAQAAARHLIAHYPITTLVSLGFAGALTNELRAGDVVLYSAVHYADAAVSQQGAYCVSDDLLARSTGALEGVAVNIFCKPGVTVPHAVLSPEEKGELADAFDASVVDMESYWISEVASEAKIPFVIIRSVSDTRSERLLPFEQMMDEEGNVLWSAAAGYFLRHPRHLAVVSRLYRNARVAQRSLGISIDRVVAELQRREGNYP